ncbi:S1C family serine protease [Actinomadura sp. HBU206391]|uniref:S1C family serine protease n=1 Tax=Actinomadura sp. HBU206391 TaxID=2731692 RepID=UPI002905B6B9|nr:trypsin-like peptidase domain-containing protein [Actinomadura sp. HBU206391]
MHRVGRTRAVAASAIIAMGVPLLAGCQETRTARRTARTIAPTIKVGEPAAQLERQFEQVARTVLPSVVQITTDQGEGSGVIYDDRGHIVTNAHVVAGASTIKVTQASGGKPLVSRLVGLFSADDLAVIKVDGAVVRPAVFGDSAKLRLGQIVMAMGSPLGLTGSVTDGIISGIGRTVSSEREGAFPGATISSAVQTSAAINPGNSGGALVTMNGQVMGIPTLIAAASPGKAAQGIGFAVPSNTVKSIAPQLIKYGKVTSSGRAALGVSVTTVINQSTGEPAGVGVIDVIKGGGAAKAGIHHGDVIIAVNGAPTPAQGDLAKVLAALKPGDKVQVTVLRNGGRRNLEVRLGELPGY